MTRRFFCRPAGLPGNLGELGQFVGRNDPLPADLLAQATLLAELMDSLWAEAQRVGGLADIVQIEGGHGHTRIVDYLLDFVKPGAVFGHNTAKPPQPRGLRRLPAVGDTGLEPVTPSLSS